MLLPSEKLRVIFDIVDCLLDDQEAGLPPPGMITLHGECNPNCRSSTRCAAFIQVLNSEFEPAGHLGD